jgi:hypothetical protein
MELEGIAARDKPSHAYTSTAAVRLPDLVDARLGQLARRRLLQLQVEF